MLKNPFKKVPAIAACALLVVIGFSRDAANAATSVSQYGITWTFSADRPVGQFVNGDWWVVGPVTLTNISPKSSSASDFTNGSMLNVVPGQSQGLYYDSGTNSPQYTASKNISLQLPYTVAANNSVYSTMNNPDTWVSGSAAEKTWFKETAVLTVLSAAPPAGSFRPPYAGTNKTIKSNWNVSQMNYSALRSLAPPIAGNVPDRAWLEEATKRPLLEMHYNYLNSNWKASWAPTKSGGYPRRTYGREISHISSEAGLFLQTNAANSTKERLLINMCQWGIDVGGLLEVGMQWQPNGGHNHGRLLPLFIAAKVLGDSDLLAKCSASRSVFQEHAQHWFVTQTDINTPRTQPTIAPYTQSMLGMPEWNSGGPGERAQASSDFWNGTNYRFINGAPNTAVALTVTLMGGRASLNQESFFRYIIERYYPLKGGSAGGIIPNYSDDVSYFTRDMWNAYIGGGTDIPTDPPVQIGIGSRIETIRSTNVRIAGTLTGTLMGVQAVASTGTVVAGPTVADNITWWQVNYDTGADGWSGGDNFILSTTTAPNTPSAPTGLRVIKE